ncbi:hypothetical protein SALBM311S_03026 [Streptomyces alboniger]
MIRGVCVMWCACATGCVCVRDGVSEALDVVLRESTPRIGLWPDTSTLTAAQTVDAIVAERERARVI